MAVTDPNTQALIDEMKNLFSGLTEEVKNLQNTNSRLASRMGAGPDGTPEDFLTDTAASIKKQQTVSDYFNQTMDETLRNRFDEFRMKQDLDAFGQSFGSTLLNFNKDFGSTVGAMLSGFKSFSRTIKTSFIAAFKNKNAPIVKMREALERDYGQNIIDAGGLKSFLKQAKAGSLEGMTDSVKIAQAQKDSEAYTKTLRASQAQFALSVVGAIQSGFQQAVNALVKDFAKKLVELNINIYDFRVNLEKTLGVTKQFSRTAMESFRDVRVRGIAIEDFSKGVVALKNNFTDFTMQTEASQDVLMRNAAILDANGYSAETFAKGTQLMTKSLNMSAPAIAETQRQLVAFGMDIGVSPDVLSKQFDQASDSIAKLGIQGVKSFQRLAVAAKVTGMEVSRILQLTDKFDTFEGAAEMTGKLNAALGGNFVNAMDLMMAKDPVERFEMIRDSIKSAGLSFDEMSYFQKNFFKESLGLQDVSELSLLMSGNMDSLNDQFGKTSAEYEAMADRAQRVAKLQDFLNNIFHNLIPIIEPVIERIYELTKNFSNTEGLEKFRKAISKIAIGMSVVLAGISTVLALIPGLQGISAITYTTAGGLAALGAGLSGATSALFGVGTGLAVAGKGSADFTVIIDALKEAFDIISESFLASGFIMDQFGDSTDGTSTMIKALAGAIIGVATFLQPFIIVFDAIGTAIVAIFGVVAFGIGKLRPIMSPVLKFLGAIGLVVLTLSGIGPTFAGVVAGIAGFAGVVSLAVSAIRDLMGAANKKRSPSFMTMWGFIADKVGSLMDKFTGFRKIVDVLKSAFMAIKSVIFAVSNSFAMLIELATTDLTPVVETFKQIGSSMESVKSLPVDKIQALTTIGVAGGRGTQQVVEKEIIKTVKLVMNREGEIVIAELAADAVDDLSRAFVR